MNESVTLEELDFLRDDWHIPSATFDKKNLVAELRLGHPAKNTEAWAAVHRAILLDIRWHEDRGLIQLAEELESDRRQYFEKRLFICN